MIVCKKSQFIAVLIICGVPELIGYNFIEDVNHSILMNIIGISLIYMVTGHIICLSKNLEPEWSEKIKNDEIDVWWGLYSYWYFMFWPTYLANKREP
jgi:hypothetical protein